MLELDASLLFRVKNATALSGRPAAPCVCLCGLWMVWSTNARWEQRPHAQKQNKLQGKEVVNINKDPIRRLNVKCWRW